MGTPQLRPLETHREQSALMATNLPKPFLGPHRSESHKNLKKPVFTTTSKLSLQSCGNTSLNEPRYSFLNHLSSPCNLNPHSTKRSCSPISDPSPPTKDSFLAEWCCRPRKFYSIPFIRELSHQSTILWKKGEPISHSNPSPSPRLQNVDSLLPG